MRTLNSMLSDIQTNLIIIRSNQLILAAAIPYLVKGIPYRSYPGLALVRQNLLENYNNSKVSDDWLAYSIKLETLNIVIAEYNYNAKELFGEIGKILLNNSAISIDIKEQAFQSLADSIDGMSGNLSSSLDMNIDFHAHINTLKKHTEDIIEDHTSKIGEFKRLLTGSNTRKLNFIEIINFEPDKLELQTEYIKSQKYYAENIIPAVKVE